MVINPHQLEYNTYIHLQLELHFQVVSKVALGYWHVPSCMAKK